MFIFLLSFVPMSACNRCAPKTPAWLRCRHRESIIASDLYYNPRRHLALSLSIFERLNLTHTHAHTRRTIIRRRVYLYFVDTYSRISPIRPGTVCFANFEDLKPLSLLLLLFHRTYLITAVLITMEIIAISVPDTSTASIKHAYTGILCTEVAYDNTILLLLLLCLQRTCERAH